MNSEKVKEIKKALEQNDDNGIMYEVNDQKRTCKFIHHKDILTLINELESENERLSNTEIGELIKENEELEKQCVGWTEIYKKKKKENQQLKDRIAELEKENATLISNNADGGASCHLCINYHKRNALKQFAERLKGKFEHCVGDIYHADTIDERIDKTLKEFIND